MVVVSSDLSRGRVLHRGPGLGTKEERPPWTPRGLSACYAAPAPLGSLLGASCRSVSAGSSSSWAIPSLLSPWALHTFCPGETSWTLLAAEGRSRVTARCRSTQGASVSTTDTPRQDTCALGADSSAFCGRPRRQIEVRSPRTERRACGITEYLLRHARTERRRKVAGYLWGGLRADPGARTAGRPLRARRSPRAP